MMTRKRVEFARFFIAAIQRLKYFDFSWLKGSLNIPWICFTWRSLHWSLWCSSNHTGRVFFQKKQSINASKHHRAISPKRCQVRIKFLSMASSWSLLGWTMQTLSCEFVQKWSLCRWWCAGERASLQWCDVWRSMYSSCQVWCTWTKILLGWSVHCMPCQTLQRQSLLRGWWDCWRESLWAGECTLWSQVSIATILSSTETKALLGRAVYCMSSTPLQSLFQRRYLSWRERMRNAEGLLWRHCCHTQGLADQSTSKHLSYLGTFEQFLLNGELQPFESWYVIDLWFMNMMHGSLQCFHLRKSKLSLVSRPWVVKPAGHCAKPAEAPEAADWIIIGGGASGCAAAAALVDAGEDVLVLERGQSDLDSTPVTPVTSHQ